jgi:fructan beta-fructosidase
MHIFVDSCSVEVFGNDGYAVISDLIFPQLDHSSLTFYAHGGDVNINTLEIWSLADKI